MGERCDEGIVEKSRHVEDSRQRLEEELRGGEATGETEDGRTEVRLQATKSWCKLKHTLRVAGKVRIHSFVQRHGVQCGLAARGATAEWSGRVTWAAVGAEFVGRGRWGGRSDAGVIRFGGLG